MRSDEGDEEGSGSGSDVPSADEFGVSDGEAGAAESAGEVWCRECGYASLRAVQELMRLDVHLRADDILIFSLVDGNPLVGDPRTSAVLGYVHELKAAEPGLEMEFDRRRFDGDEQLRLWVRLRRHREGCQDADVVERWRRVGL